jgi:predicted ATPase/DNA-binding SARP family transcriptional activator
MNIASHPPVVDNVAVRSPGHVRIDVLGPLCVRDETGADVTPSGHLQRRMLALLVLCRGQVVSLDSVVDTLWPSASPADPAGAVQNHISRLRRALPAGAIEAVASGYRLDPARVSVDVDRLEAVLAAGALEGGERREVEDMLQRWHGPAYPELDDADARWGALAYLDELRNRAEEVLAEARLAAGESDQAVADLIALAGREPLRERPRSMLMSALAATGRTAEALRVYDDFRRVLAAELGIAPSPALDAQHAALLLGAAAPIEATAGRRLPAPVASLVGRQELLAEVLRVTETARIVTLVGPGGVGKTRLLVEVGHRLRAGRSDRPVVLCELAQAGPDNAADLMASTLGIDPRPGVPPIGRVIDVVADGELVLLVDNCEHVLDVVADVVERVTEGCPHVRVLLTSRERLRVRGEHVVAVPPLPTDDVGSAAAELFIDRARAVDPNFDPDGAARPCVEEIVRHLDGLPLAIELAAARLYTHEIGEIAAGLDRPLTLLTAGHRTATRHASLEAVVAWSYDLLDPETQQAFAALAVFSGPFTAGDAGLVCVVEHGTIDEMLARLVEGSLVTRAPGGRFAMLETLRAFGLDRLAATGRHDVVRRRHAERMVQWAVDADRRLSTVDPRVLFDVDEALPELWSAFGWLLEHGLVEDAGRLVVALTPAAVLRLRPDVLAWAERVLDLDPQDVSPMASQLWAAASYAAWMAGDVPESGRRSERAIALAERAGAPPSQMAATSRGNLDLFEGRLQSAAAWYRRGVDVAEDLAPRWMPAGAELLALGYAGERGVAELAESLLAEVGTIETAPAAYVWYCAAECVMAIDVDLATARMVRAIEIAELTRASFVRGVAGASKASIEARSGDPDTAARDYRWLIPHWQRAGMWSTQWTMLRGIVGLLERLGRHRQAAVLEGAVRGTAAGHRIFGADERELAECGARLRAALGDDAYEAARREGAALDGNAAVDHALASL